MSVRRAGRERPAAHDVRFDERHGPRQITTNGLQAPYLMIAKRTASR